MAYKVKKHVLMVAGEASGDLHGANLVKALKDMSPEISVSGIGGPNMGKEGVDILFPSSDMAVVGLTEVLSRFSTIIKANRELKKFLKARHPDLLILIDYPDFNLHLARIANRFDVPVFYYISPQVWAWRKGRVKKIADRVDRMAVILPFEKDFYQNTGTNLHVEYVGHPILDAIPEIKDREEIIKEWELQGADPVLGLLPGSRNEEIANLLPVMLEAAEKLASRYKNLKCVLPVAPTISYDLLHSILNRSSLDVIVSDKGTFQTLSLCDLAFVTSGTATLETAVMLVPMIIIYRVSGITYRIGKLFVKVPHVGLVNLIAGEEIVPELIQAEATSGGLVDKALVILENNDYRKGIIQGLRKVKQKLGTGGASIKAARIALEMMEEN